MVNALRQSMQSIPPAIRTNASAIGSTPLSCPVSYSGDPGSCNEFLLQCSLYIKANALNFPNEISKVAPRLSSLNAFVSHFKEVFGVALTPLSVHDELINLRQGLEGGQQGTLVSSPVVLEDPTSVVPNLVVLEDPTPVVQSSVVLQDRTLVVTTLVILGDETLMVPSLVVREVPEQPSPKQPATEQPILTTAVTKAITASYRESSDLTAAAVAKKDISSFHFTPILHAWAT
ncbi:hypothetical protein Q8A67_012529 [Cirrhinus molitorella]|uniref:Uncharacterized protein n=1 Tax=Cirrhinus molitorella TaxID=172907 RepID=A0AA88PTE2_9TELE|nr:hypothetical protein Q8A67_012529 [Cirrhinus molitorella]